MKYTWITLALLACSLGGSRASAQAREHDGFMLRLTAGVGYGSLSTETPSVLTRGRTVEQALRGVGATFAVDVGGSPVTNFALHGRFGFFVLSSPTLSLDGRELGESDDTAVSMYLFAPAVTYYFMPVNIYVTAAAGLAFAGITYDDGNRRERGSTDLGWGLNADAGMEFWVGSSWGLGPAVRFFYISAPEDIEGLDIMWHGLGAAVCFSGTFQ